MKTDQKARPWTLPVLSKTLFLFASAGTLALTLSGCGGGGGSSIPPLAQVATLSGTAATGAALANASVAITDSSGTSPCVETTITTTALGSYSCTLTSGKTAPFFVVVTDPTGNTPVMVSVQTTTPAAGQSLTVNVTPLTTAIVAQLAADGNALSVVSSRTIDAQALKAVTDNVVAQIAKVLTAIGAPAGYNPFTTSITAATSAATGNTADLVLEIVRVSIDAVSGKPALSTISDPTTVLMATASSTGGVVDAPAANVSTLTQGTQIIAKAFNDCFAIATPQRVLEKDTTITDANGGPEVENVAAACQTLAWFQDPVDDSKPNFLHNGYSDGQFFYDILTNDKMTGAKFSVPEIMSFTAAVSPSTIDSATVNIKYVDMDGNPGNLVTVASRYVGTSNSTRTTDWWLAGNQHHVDVSTRLVIRRVEQFNLANTNTKKISTFQTGIQFRINYTGPGSTFNSEPLAFARVSGPGLPGNGVQGTGLVFIPSQTAYTNYMDLLNKSGTLPAGTNYACGGNIDKQTFDCPNLWLSRTAGLTGADATTLATNPTGNSWAQSEDAVDATKIVNGQKYHIELFYGSNRVTAGQTLNKTLNSSLVQATQAVNLPWNTAGPAIVNALNPNGPLAGAQVKNLPLDWTQNPAAQQIANATAVIDGNSSYGLWRQATKGATSLVLDNLTVPAFSLTTPVSRNLILSYRMLDTSNKTAVYSYN